MHISNFHNIQLETGNCHALWVFWSDIHFFRHRSFILRQSDSNYVQEKSWNCRVCSLFLMFYLYTFTLCWMFAIFPFYCINRLSKECCYGHQFNGTHCYSKFILYMYLFIFIIKMYCHTCKYHIETRGFFNVCVSYLFGLVCIWRNDL